MPETLFVGRERETDLYKKFLAKKTPWVLIITGLGGIGKSTLLHRLIEYTAKEPDLSETGVIMLDFADEELRNNPLKLLDKLTKDTASYCDVQQIDVELKNELQQNFDQLAQLSQERIQTGVNEAEDLALREMRHQMRQLATEAFYIQIKTFKLDRLIIILDTCEWLNEPEGVEVGQWVLNELIPGIHTRVRQKSLPCSVVIASRVQPRLDVINGQEQRRLNLPMLGKVEVDQYLEHMGMQDADLRQRVYEVTHGHALCISIIGDFWQKREEGTQPLTLADLPEQQLEEFSEIALIRFTNERVLKQLKTPFKELTRYGVLLRSFDLPLLKIVFPELLPESAALERFNQLIHYPYIESRGNYRYAFHELVREALAEETQKEDPESWKSYHKRALDYFIQTLSRSPDWHYHFLAYDEKQGLMEWQQAIQEARESGKREYIGALLQAALDKALKLSPAARAEVVYEQGRFNYYGGQWEEALKSYQEALTSFQEVGDYLGQAKVLAAIGDVQRVFAKQDDALASYEQALASFQQVGDGLGRAKVLQAIGDVQRLRNEPRAALLNYEQALDLFQRVGDYPGQAKVLEAIGDVQGLLNDYDAALQSYEQALALYQEEKNRLKRAKVLKAIGDGYRLQQDKNAALESYEQALALFGELKEPTEEANVRRAIEEMQRSILVPYVIPEGDHSDPPTFAVSDNSPILSSLLQQGYILNGPFGQVILGSTIVTIGRALINQLVLKDSKISRAHAEIRPLDQGYSIIDLGSANGTFVNEQRIDANVPYTLNPGDRIRVGDTSFTYEVSSASQIAPPVYGGAMPYSYANSGTTTNDATYISTPYAATQQTSPAQYAATPYEAAPQAPSDTPPYGAMLQNPYSTSPYDPYSAMPPTPIPAPVPPSPTKRPGNRISIIVGVVVLVLVLIGGGVFALLSRSGSKPVPTPVVNGTPSAPITTVPTTAGTAVVSQAPYTHSGTLAFSDPLSDNSQGHNWEEYHTNCTFTGGAYHVIAPDANYADYCLADTTNFSDFVLEAQMQVVKGDGGGIVFRVTSTNPNNEYYEFIIGQDGSYDFYLVTGNSSSDSKTLTSGSNPAITQGLNQTNVIAIVAKGNTIMLYVNHQPIDKVTDSTYTGGKIGFVAYPNTKPTEVAFSNLKVWTL